MKKLFFLLLALVVCTLAYASAKLIITLKDGTVIEYSFEDIESILYKVEEERPLSSPNLSLERFLFSPGEEIRVRFFGTTGLASNAWIGIVPSEIPHGSEAENDKHDLAFSYLNGRTEGELLFKAPTKPGLYDFRLHDTDNNGKELDYITFEVK
jgi:hypothetical protein